jgi:molecular chaperone DnaK
MANKASDIYKNLTKIDEAEARIRVDLPDKRLPLALSIELPGGYVSEVVPADVRLPITITKMFSTADSFQLAAEFNILLGNRPLVHDNCNLCRIRVRNIKWSSAGIPQIELLFEVDETGLITISAANLDRSNAEILVFMAQKSVSHDEIERALANAQEHETEDKIIRNHIQKAINCYAFIGAANDYYSAAKRKLDFFAKNKYKQARKRLQKALEVEPAAATDQTVRELEAALEVFRDETRSILPAFKQVMTWYK